MANGMVHEAFQYQRQRRNTSNATEMMQYFYGHAEKLGKLDIVLQMSLVLVEEEGLVDFLQRSGRSSSQASSSRAGPTKCPDLPDPTVTHPTRL